MGVRPESLRTGRLTLRRWSPADRDLFAAMNADPDVMADLGGPISRTASDAKLERFDRAFETGGIGRWLIEGSLDGARRFLGYAGVMRVGDDHPLGSHHEIGWRLCRSAWGHGIATEAACAALDDAFERAGLDEVLAYTAPDNVRSQAVMERLGLRRDPARDFVKQYDDVGEWTGLVWVASPERTRR